MPTDITGTEIIQDTHDGRHFEFAAGPIFANVILADEINRTPPKTQAALLEAMQEQHVTAAGETHTLDDPFFVLATQNPIEQEGTYPLPEAQLDRFMLNLWLDYPSFDEEAEVWVYGDVALGLDPVERLDVYLTKDLLFKDSPEREAEFVESHGIEGVGKTVRADWADAHAESLRANPNGYAAPEKCLAAHLTDPDEPVHLEVCNASFEDNVTQRLEGALALENYEQVLDPRGACLWVDGERSPTAFEKLRRGATPTTTRLAVRAFKDIAHPHNSLLRKLIRFAHRDGETSITSAVTTPSTTNGSFATRCSSAAADLSWARIAPPALGWVLPATRKTPSSKPRSSHSLWPSMNWPACALLSENLSKMTNMLSPSSNYAMG